LLKFFQEKAFEESGGSGGGVRKKKEEEKRSVIRGSGVKEIVNPHNNRIDQPQRAGRSTSWKR
jgi:hypothetical protein